MPRPSPQVVGVTYNAKNDIGYYKVRDTHTHSESALDPRRGGTLPPKQVLLRRCQE